MEKGIDVSKWQGSINFSKVKADGINFAIIRASYGKESIDECFKANIEGFKKANIPVGVYHYCYAKSTTEAITEAKHFTDVIKGNDYKYGVWLDLEDKCIPKNKATDIAITFMDEVKKAGYKVGIYANLNWFKNILNDSRLKSYPHWLAQWGDKPSFSSDMWQYTSDGKVNGINGRIDMDYCYVDYAIKKPVIKPAKPIPKSGVVTASVLNIRKGPGLFYRKIGKLNKGTVVKISCVKNGWYNIYFGDHGGYVYSKYIK